jgi:hypothetical protein
VNLTNRAVTLPLWAILYFVLGYFSHKFNGLFTAAGYIWLPAGVTVAAFMLAPMRRWLGLGLAFLVAQMLLGMVEGRDAFRMVLFSLDEIGFAALAVAVIHLTKFSLEGLAFLRGLLLAGVSPVSAGRSSARAGSGCSLMCRSGPPPRCGPRRTSSAC